MAYSSPLRVGDFVYTREFYDPDVKHHASVHCHIAQVESIRPGKGTTLRYFLRPVQTKHYKNHVFYKQELFATNQCRTFSGDLSSFLLGKCWVLSARAYTTNDPIYEDSVGGKPDDKDIYLCRSKYDVVKTTFTKPKLDFKFSTAYAGRLRERSTEAGLRELEKLDTARLFYDGIRSIDGVEIIFVADNDVPEFIRSIVERPPLPLESKKRPSSTRDGPALRPFEAAGTSGLADDVTVVSSDDDTDDDTTEALAPGRRLEMGDRKSEPDPGCSDSDAVAGSDLYTFNTRPQQKRRRVEFGVRTPEIGGRLSAVFPNIGIIYGTIAKISRNGSRLFVVYDDGDEGWADFPEVGLELLGTPGGKAAVSAGDASGGRTSVVSTRRRSDRKNADSADDGAAADCAGPVIGKRVCASFPGDGDVFGTIAKIKKTKRGTRLFVHYDDGDEGWADYPDDGFSLVEEKDPGPDTAAEGGSASLRRQDYVLDQDDGNSSDVCVAADGDDDGESADDDDDDDDSADENEPPGEGDDVAGRESFAHQETRDNYFHQQKSKGGKSRSSDRTLAKLEAATMDQADVNEILKDFEHPFADCEAVLKEKILENADFWMAALASGFNILCYGFGSKKSVLMDFAFSHLKRDNIIVVNGYFPSLNIKQILKTIVEESLGFDGSFRSALEQMHFIRDKFEEGGQRQHYILVHNIDGPMIRNDTSQTILSMLAATRNISIVASIDHINAPLMWDHAKLAKFNWIWQDCTTFAPYVVETSYETALNTRASTLSVRGALAVMQSLTKNGRKVFWILLTYQMEHVSDADYPGLNFSKYLYLCQKQFAAHDDARLRSYMTEFIDHKLLKTSKIAGVEYLAIPAKGTMLQSLHDMMSENFGEDAPTA
eukprot:m.162124 g.162124  ORF g.162124 m.162124 type:complete len:883 (-) comp18064_c0_seq16:2233-4881(-)